MIIIKSSSTSKSGRMSQSKLKTLSKLLTTEPTLSYALNTFPPVQVICECMPHILNVLKPFKLDTRFDKIVINL